MRVTYRLSVWLVAGNCLVLGGYGALALHREVSTFRRTMERDTRSAGEALLLLAGERWAAEGRDAALAAIERSSQRHPELSFRWLEGEALRRALGDQELRDEPVFVRSPSHLRAFVPFHPPRGPAGSLVVSKSLERDQRYVSRSLFALGLATLASILVSAGLAAALGQALVGAPMRRLVARLQRVGGGQLSERLDLDRRDEFGALAHAVDRMSASLEEARDQALREANERAAALGQLRHAERLATIGRLAAGVAHELGTPLNVILARAKLAQRQREQPAQVTAHTDTIAQQAQRMTRIVRQLLDFARADESKKEPCDLRELARGCLDVLASLARKRGVELALLAPESAPLLADPTQLEQVLTNLVMNAIQASPSGGVVRVEVDPRDDRVEVCVSDEGPGVPREQAERIFEPFFTTKDVGEGTGLGLPVAHGIVHEHGGTIELVEGEAGARFRIVLPRRERGEA